MAIRTQKLDDAEQVKPATTAAGHAAADKCTSQRPARRELSRDETRARIKAFAAEREEAFVAAVREDEV